MVMYDMVTVCECCCGSFYD